MEHDLRKCCLVLTRHCDLGINTSHKFRSRSVNCIIDTSSMVEVYIYIYIYRVPNSINIRSSLQIAIVTY